MGIIPAQVTVDYGWRSPTVMVIQHVLNLGKPKLDVDGIFGEHTAKRVSEICDVYKVDRLCSLRLDEWRNERIYDEGIDDDWLSTYLRLIALAVISSIEVGYRKHAFDHIEMDIGDGAGKNYGAYCFNSRGSMHEFMRRFPGLTREEALRQPTSGPMQNEILIEKARLESHVIDAYARREPGSLREKFYATLLTLDVVTQNGSWSYLARAPKLYDEAWWNKIAWWFPWETVESYGRDGRALFTTLFQRAEESHIDLQQALVVAGTLRAWASRPKYAHAVRKRKVALATGHGKIHGTQINIPQDWGIEDWIGQ